MELLARLANLPGALPGACAQGLIWGIMAIGVYLTYRILDVADLTVDGSFGTGGAVCVMCLLSGQNVWVSLLVAVLAGLATGVWLDRDEIRSPWHCNLTFAPQMDEAERTRLLAGWHKAVGRSCDWAEH